MKTYMISLFMVLMGHIFCNATIYNRVLRDDVAMSESNIHSDLYISDSICHDKTTLYTEYIDKSMTDGNNVVKYVVIDLPDFSTDKMNARIWITILLPICLILTGVIILCLNKIKLRKTNSEEDGRCLKEYDYEITSDPENNLRLLAESIGIERQKIAFAQTRLELERKQLAERERLLEIERLLFNTEKECWRNKKQKSQLKNDLKLSNIISHIIEQLSIPDGKIANSDIALLKETLSLTYPNFISNLNELGLSERDYIDALFIKVSIPQKLCASYFHTSPSSLTNIRKRLFLKHCKDSTSTSWKHFILNL